MLHMIIMGFLKCILYTCNTIQIHYLIRKVFISISIIQLALAVAVQEVLLNVTSHQV